MKKLFLALAATAALGLSVAPAVEAQQVRGKDCQWAFKKLQQHQNKVNGRCFESTNRTGPRDSGRPDGEQNDGQSTRTGRDHGASSGGSDNKDNGGKHDDSSN